MNTNVTILLAPSKTMDFTIPIPPHAKPQKPMFLTDAEKIASKLKPLSLKKIQKLMGISEPIAEAVQGYYSNWNIDAIGRPALWTYVGDVYKGISAMTLTTDDADWAQEHLLISSGLYGLARPYDGIQAYRLEMKAAIKIGRKNNLYELWGDKLAKYIDGQASDWLCNCSSDEYAKVVLKHLKKPIITPVFFDTKPNGIIGTVPIYSKMMRGVIARWMIDHRVTNPDQLKDFAAHGYAYDSERSKPDLPAYSRPKMVPLKFVQT